MITDRFMVDVSSVFGKTELKLSQQESNFWYLKLDELII